MSTLLAELASREILTGVTVRRLREYISNKYPQLSPALRAGIFADAVNRIVAGKLPELPEDKAGLFRAFLYGDAAKKQVFSIDCSDVFKSSLKLRTTDRHFVKGLAVWLEETLLVPVSEDKVFEYVSNVCKILDEAPDIGIEKVLDDVQRKVGDISPKKRVISLIRMNQPAVGTMSGAQTERGREAACKTAGRAAGKAGADLDTEHAGSEDFGMGMDYVSRGDPDRDGVSRKDKGEFGTDAEGTDRADAGEDWIIIKKRKSAGEILAGSISRLVEYTAGFYRRIVGFAADAAPRGSGYRIAAISGIFAAALLITFLSALYVKGITGAEPGQADDMPEAAEIAIIDEAMIPAGAAAGNGASGNGESRGEVLRMRATAYDLSVESCGKDREHPEYGITYSGTRAEAGRTVAVDPEVIPLGSSIRITFPEEYSHLDGIYVAEDTGRLITGNNIDIFFGEDEEGSREIYKKALKFGVQYVEVEVMDDKQALR